MKIAALIVLFIIGGLFLNASHIPAWLLAGGKPTHAHWKLYALIGAMIWVVLAVLANVW